MSLFLSDCSHFSTEHAIMEIINTKKHRQCSQCHGNGVIRSYQLYETNSRHASLFFSVFFPLFLNGVKGIWEECNKSILFSFS